MKIHLEQLTCETGFGKRVEVLLREVFNDEMEEKRADVWLTQELRKLQLQSVIDSYHVQQNTSDSDMWVIKVTAWRGDQCVVGTVSNTRDVTTAGWQRT